MLVGEIRILAVFLERAGGENLPAFHVEVVLRASERIIFPGFPDHATGSGSGPERVGSAHSVSVEALVCSSVAGFFAAVSERENDDAIGLAGHAPCCGDDFAVRKHN